MAVAAAQGDLARVMDEGGRLHGRIDALVLNAGLSEPATLRRKAPSISTAISPSMSAARCLVSRQPSHF